MNDAIPFNSDEIAAINAAKNELQNNLASSKVFELRDYLVDSKSTKVTNVTPEALDKLVVAGGCISSILHKEYVNDFDVFILNMDISLFEELVALKTGPWVIKWFLDPNEDMRHEDYKNEHIFATASNSLTKVQYILTDYTSRKELLDHFDFLHATASYHNGKLYINRETYDSIMKKQLVRQHKKVAPRDWRVQKYLAKGWKSEADGMLNDSKTLNDILNDHLDQLKSVNPWAKAANKSNWIDDSVNKAFANSMAKGQTIYSPTLEEQMRAILKDGIDPYLQTR